jgi:hypothetical protein
MAVEFGGRTGMVAPDEVTLVDPDSYAAQRRQQESAAPWSLPRQLPSADCVLFGGRGDTAFSSRDFEDVQC